MAASIVEIANVITIVGLCVIALAGVWVARTLIRVRKERRVAAGALDEKQLEWRGDLIKVLIETVGRDTSRSARLKTIRRKLGWTEGHTQLVLDYLTGEGLVERANWGAIEGGGWETLGRLTGGQRVRLTGAGLNETGRAERGPTENLPHIVATGSIVTIGGRNVQSTLGSPRARQALAQQGVDPGVLTAWIEKYDEALDRPSPLSVASIEHARELLSQLEDAAAGGDAKQVTERGRTLRAIAEGVVGNAVFEALVHAAKDLPFG